MPQIIRVYIRSALIGALLAVVFTAALLVLDVAHLRHLILASSSGPLAVAMLIAFNTILFGGVQFAFIVMAQADPRPPSGRRRLGRQPVAAMQSALSSGSGSRKPCHHDANESHHRVDCATDRATKMSRHTA